jgi:hypothetical protein
MRLLLDLLRFPSFRYCFSPLQDGAKNAFAILGGAPKRLTALKIFECLEMAS